MITNLADPDVACAMITNLADLDVACDWMRRNGYTKHEPDAWQLCVAYGGFEIVSRGAAYQWILYAKSPTMNPLHGFPRDTIVAPWVVDQIKDLRHRDASWRTE